MPRTTDCIFTAGDSFESGNESCGASDMGDPRGPPRRLWKLSTDTVDSANASSYSYRDEVYFMANDGEAGWELHKNDGTPAGTGMAADINQGPGDGFAIPKLVFDDQLLFLADNGTNGMEIWTLGRVCLRRWPRFI